MTNLKYLREKKTSHIRVHKQVYGNHINLNRNKFKSKPTYSGTTFELKRNEFMT